MTVHIFVFARTLITSTITSLQSMQIRTWWEMMTWFRLVSYLAMKINTENVYDANLY